MKTKTTLLIGLVFLMALTLMGCKSSETSHDEETQMIRVTIQIEDSEDRSANAQPDATEDTLSSAIFVLPETISTFSWEVMASHYDKAMLDLETNTVSLMLPLNTSIRVARLDYATDEYSAEQVYLEQIDPVVYGFSDAFTITGEEDAITVSVSMNDSTVDVSTDIYDPDVPQYSVSGTVSGLTGSGLVLQNSNGDELNIEANGVFTFDQLINDGSTYSIAIKESPVEPDQTCTIANGSGDISGDAVYDVTVTCADSHRIFFHGTQNGVETGLWMSNGTEEGTVLVKITNQYGGKSLPQNFCMGLSNRMASIGDTTYFTAGSSSSNLELWKTDGTDEGTQLVKDIYPDFYQSAPNNYKVLNGEVFFAANSAAGRELWKSDGTESGTEMVMDINPGSSSGLSSLGFFEYNNELYFAADNGSDGRELWKSNGTQAGTEMVSNINTDTSFKLANPDDFVEFKGELYFAAHSSVDAANDRELWKSNGTDAGTVRVKDINPSGHSHPSQLLVWNDMLYFVADDGINGKELWISDGTDEGTVMLKDINPGSEDSYPGEFTVLNNTLYFTAKTGTHGFELWKTDGTEEGTLMVIDIAEGSGSSDPNMLTVANGMIFFWADDTAGTDGELWRSDGTAAGTMKVKEINTSGSAIDPTYECVELKESAGVIFFAATTDADNLELWRSDGTEQGTYMVKDVNESGSGFFISFPEE